MAKLAQQNMKLSLIVKSFQLQQQQQKLLSSWVNIDQTTGKKFA